VSSYGDVRGPRRQGFPWRRLAVLAVPLALGVQLLVALPGTVSADTVAGRATTGCFGANGYAHTLYSGSALRVANIGISFRLTIYTPTPGDQSTSVVATGGWQLSPQGATWRQANWVANNSLSTTQYMVTEATGWPFTTVNLETGSTGTLTYKMFLRSYQPGGCFTIDNVRVSINRVNLDGATPPPGGGGFATPSPTPPGATPTPTVPPNPTHIPGATPGPGVECFRDALGTVRCYPKAPPGYCYVEGAIGAPQLEKCGDATNSPPPPDPYACSTLLANGIDFCFPWGPVTASIGGNGTTIGTINDWDAGQGEIVGIGGWAVFDTTRTGTAFVDFRFATGGSGCTIAGDWSQTGFIADWTATGPTTNFIRNADQSTGFKKTVTSRNATVGSSGNNWGGSCNNASNDKTVLVSMTAGGFAGAGTTSFSGVFFGTMGDPIGNPSPTPSPSPSASLPPNYWGPGGMPPPSFEFDIDVDVDVCEDDPTIIMCQHSFPPMNVDLCASNPTIAACSSPVPSIAAPDSSAAQGAFAAVYDHLRSKAPFGYVDQVASAVGGSFAGAAGADEDFCFELQAPPVEWCIPNLAGAAAPIRTLLLALMSIVFAMVVFGMTTKAPDGQVD
jgi:hypothetical protein